MIEAILEGARTAPVKQQHTPTLIFDRFATSMGLLTVTQS
jgi:hypothetical protein